MSLAKNILLLIILIMTCILAICYYSPGTVPWSFLITFLGLLWLFIQWRGRTWSGTIGFIVFSGAIIRAVYLDIPSGWLLACMVLNLSAWDIDRFIARVRRAGEVERLEDMEFAHLMRLASVAAAGLVLGSITLLVKIRLSFGWMLFLSACLVFIVSWLFDLLKKKPA